MLEQINPYVNVLGGVITNPIVLIIFGTIAFIAYYIFVNKNNMPNNPYLMDSLKKRFSIGMVKNRYRLITVNYIRIGNNNTPIVTAIRRELKGKNGLYLEYIDEVVEVPSEYFITGAGEDDVLHYVLTDNKIGYPIKFELLKEKEDIENKESKYMIGGILASKKKHDLFSSQHFRSLSEGLKQRLNRGKTQLDRLLETGVPTLFIMLGFMAFILIYNFAVTSQNDLSENIHLYQKQAFTLQENFMARDRYCQVFIARHGAEADLNKYLSYPTGFEEFNDTS